SAPTATTTWTRWSARRWRSTGACAARRRWPEAMPGTPAGPSEPLFASRFMAGFECASQRRRDGRRLDLAAATGHDRHARADYTAVHALGFATARDGLRWHLIERAAGYYDWSSFLPMLRAAEAEG